MDIKKQSVNNKEKSTLLIKSYDFAVKIVKLTQYIQRENQEYILSKQLIRSGTAIGALIKEAEYAQSKADFIHKLSISLKEANETEYWINLLKDTGYISVNQYSQFSKECLELIYILISSIKTLKNKD